MGRRGRGSLDSSTAALLLRAHTNLPSASGLQAELHSTGDGPHTARLPPLPPKDQVYDASFFRRLFDRADKLGYTRDGGIHVATLHHFCRRMSDCVGSEEILFDPHQVFSPSRMPFRSSPYVSWTDMRHALEDVDEFGLHSLDVRINLNIFERISMGFSGGGSSVFGSCWAAFTFVLIIFSCIHIMSEQLQGRSLGTVIVLIFTADYAVKLCCSPFVRFAVSHPDQLLSVTVPDPANLAMPAGKARYERVISFVTTPMNLLDVVSVAPYWINFMTDFPFNLGFLRALRILRAAYSLKIGTFSDMLAILGETLRGSAGSLLVTIIWTLMISLLIGPVLQQIAMDQGTGDDGKTAPWSFDSVPYSVAWVVGRLCNMHGSVQEKQHIPSQDAAALVVLFVGICKGCVLLVPVGQIAASFRSANDEFKQDRKNQEQIAREKFMFLGTEWNRDPLNPSVRLELLDAEDDSVAGVATFNVPILETREVSSTVIVHISSKNMQGHFWSANPTVKLLIDWSPTGEFHDEKVRNRMSEKIMNRSSSLHSTPPELKREPRGVLSIGVESGHGFQGGADSRWKCRVQVPVGLHGYGSLQELITEPSQGGAPDPYWEKSSEDFDIDWTYIPDQANIGRSSTIARSRTMHRWIDRFMGDAELAPELAFEKQVLEILYQREAYIRYIEGLLDLDSEEKSSNSTPRKRTGVFSRISPRQYLRVPGGRSPPSSPQPHRRQTSPESESASPSPVPRRRRNSS